MNLSNMQDLLNKLNAFFKVFVYPEEPKRIVLRVFYDSEENDIHTDMFMDIVYDFEGNCIAKKET